MTERGEQLHAIAGGQIAELIKLISTLGKATLRMTCPGREKLGDGTVGAGVQHTADNYQRIAAFLETIERLSSAHPPGQPGGHRIPRFLRAVGHRPPDHAQHGQSAGSHADQYTADNVDLRSLREQLSGSSDTLWRIAELTDSQLDAIPPEGSFRFCDGQRTLEQVLASVLKHQGHQLEALRAATV